MAKTLLEVYRQLQELANPAMVKAAQGAAKARESSKALGGFGNVPSTSPAGQKPAPVASTPQKPISSPDARMGGNPTAGGTARPPSAPPAGRAPGGGGIQGYNQRQVGSAQRFRPSAAPAPAARPAAPVRPGERVPGERVASNRQLTAQATARKGFGSTAAGGNYKAAQTPVAPALDPGRNKALDNPTTQSNMALAQNPNINGAGGSSGSMGKQTGSGTTIKKPGDAQAATPPASSGKQSWSQKVGKAMRDHVRKGGKAGDTITVDGKKIKVSWKDKAYERRLTKGLSEQRVVKKTLKSMLAHPAARLGKGQQSISKGRRYRIRVKPLAEGDKNAKKSIRISFEPETPTSWN